jgi:hypothetical protein
MPPRFLLLLLLLLLLLIELRSPPSLTLHPTLTDFNINLTSNPIPNPYRNPKLDPDPDPNPCTRTNLSYCQHQQLGPYHTLPV